MTSLQLKFTLAILWLYIICNIISFAAYGIDKRKAKKSSWRIPEKTLLIFSAVFGAIGALGGMYTFHHKTKKWYFVLFNSLFAVVHIFLLYFFITKWVYLI